MTSQLHLNDTATQALVAWAQQVRAEADSDFAAAQQLVTQLGAHVHDGQTAFGFWTPEIAAQDIPPGDVFLELFTPLETLDLALDAQRARFRRDRVALVRDGDYLWGVVDGVQAGTRTQIGALYWVRWRDSDGNWQRVIDYLAYSVPFGAFAPAEVYAMVRLQAERPDRAHFAALDLAPDPDGVMRVQAPTNILQIHVNTGSAAGTLAGLTAIYTGIADKLRRDEPLTPAEQNYIGYDAVQLMPIAPTIEYEAGPRFWQPAEDDPLADEVTVDLRRPDMTNWGYDILLTSMSATNPAVLGTGRPDEVVDFIAALHNFPGQPVKAMFDIVYGHIDNQATPLLNEHFFAGPGMYGQTVNFRHPVVRALLLEMQRRKHQLGVDGIRVDGAQDFKNYNAETGEMDYDDDFLRLMNDIELEVAGTRYRPWMIFEDGRPWPRDDWELASSYREVTIRLPNVFQWGPLTFAHNTPFLYTFWISKWWRIREIIEVGGRWITGCANHDTLRRGTQVPIDARVNTYLGATLPDIFRKAYDNPAAKLFDYAMMPGVPMDFINAAMRAPWAFIRNTDDRWAVKVVSEEARFLHWVMDEALFARERTFARLKALGFVTLAGLRRFMRMLDHVVQATEYDQEAIAQILTHTTPPLEGGPFTVARLKIIARAWMDDVQDVCNVGAYAGSVDPVRAAYNLAVRSFRRARPWLIENLRSGEHLSYLHPTGGSIVFYGLRIAPDGSETLLFVANMEGAPRTLAPLDLLPDLPRDGWGVALKTPGLRVEHIAAPLTVADSQGVVFAHS